MSLMKSLEEAVVVVTIERYSLFVSRSVAEDRPAFSVILVNADFPVLPATPAVAREFFFYSLFFSFSASFCRRPALPYCRIAGE
jgi:hypothetical protein